MKIITLVLLVVDSEIQPMGSGTASLFKGSHTATSNRYSATYSLPIL